MSKMEKRILSRRIQKVLFTTGLILVSYNSGSNLVRRGSGRCDRSPLGSMMKPCGHRNFSTNPSHQATGKYPSNHLNPPKSIMTYHDISWHIMTYHDISWHHILILTSPIPNIFQPRSIDFHSTLIQHLPTSNISWRSRVVCSGSVWFPQCSPILQGFQGARHGLQHRVTLLGLERVTQRSLAKVTCKVISVISVISISKYKYRTW